MEKSNVPMKIKIHKEKYINNPCPTITKELWDGFYDRLFITFRNKNYKKVKKIRNIHIRINQAYKGCWNIHFYVTINKGLKHSFEFHMDSEHFREKRDLALKPRYMWLVDFINCGSIDMGTTKPVERYNEYWRIRKLKSKTKDNVKRLSQRYREYLSSKEYFETI
jgi:hypothetical protein